MDPTASFVITAKDQTAAAIASANKNLNMLARGANSLRSSFAAIGVALSGRAFFGWVSSAIEATKVTADTAEGVKVAKEAFDNWHHSSQDLAVSIGQKLAPALDLGARALRGWKAEIAATEIEKIQKDLRGAYDEIYRLNVELENPGLRRRSLSEVSRLLEEARGRAAALLAEYVNLTKAQSDAAGKNSLVGGEMLTQDEWVKLESFLYDLNHQKPLAQTLSPGLEEFINQLKEGAELTKDMRTEGEKNLETLQEAQNLFEAGIISPETMLRVRDSLITPIEVTAKRLKQLAPEVNEFAVSIGRGLHDTFVDWFAGIDVSFRDLLKKMAAEAVVSGLFKGLSATFGGTSTFLGSMFGGFLADGGPLVPGKWHIAGEHGPEPIWGGGPGAFAYAGGGMSSGPVQVQIDQHFSTDLTPDQALAMGRVVAQSVYSALKKEQSGRR